MKAPFKTRNEDSYLQLLRDFGFTVRGTRIVQLRVGWVGERDFGSCRDVFDAAERLIPIISDDTYYNRLKLIGAN